MYKVLFLPLYHYEGPSSRYRTFNYIKYFEKNSMSITILPFFYNGYVVNKYNKRSINFYKLMKSYLKRIVFLLKHKDEFDFIVIEKDLLPYIPYFVEKLLLKNTSYSVDFDDNRSFFYNRSILKKFFFW